MKLIDKDALVAEIEKREGLLDLDNPLGIGGMVELECLKNTLDTLEVKEVDLEKELNDYGYYYDYVSLDRKELVDFAKHFFELGLKARHDNWKVVDNTNLPQEDRNKIYCVFTKQHYILAKVINHPQDAELLQWKCTEFPHHCYDMCEGDKYMQIV